MGSREGKTYATVAATTKSYLTKWGKIHGSHFGSIKDQSFNDAQPLKQTNKHTLDPYISIKSLKRNS